MRVFIVAVASLSSNTNRVFRVSANNPEDARREAIELAGLNEHSCFYDQNEHIVSEAYDLSFW